MCGPCRVPGILQLAEGRQRRKSVTATPNTVFPSYSTDLRLDLVISSQGWEERLSVSTERKDMVW